MSDYSFYKRQLRKGKPVIYVRFKQGIGWTSGHNTKCTSLKLARAWAKKNEARIIEPEPIDTERPEDITFKQAATGFFEWEGEWSLDRRSTGVRHSLRSCIEKTELLNNRVLPYFRNMNVLDIGPRQIKDFRNHLFQKGLSPSSINKSLIVVRTILKYLVEREIIDRVPIVAGAAISKKEKEIFSIEEIRRLFSIEWSDPRAKAAAILACSTGIRAGECQSLKIGQINLAERYIIIKHSWDERMRVENLTTKGGRARTIFFPAAVEAEIRELLAIHPRRDDPDEYLFFSLKTPGQPCLQRVFTRSCYKALREIGITEKERVRRGLNFHAFRHFVNSLFLNQKIPLLMVQQMIGHNSQQMSEAYYHTRPEDFEPIRKVQEMLFKGE